MSLVTALGRHVAAARVLNKVPVPVVSRRSTLFSTITSDGDAVAQMRAMGQNSVLFAIVDKLATGVATTQWRLYRKSTNGNDEDRTEVTSHPALVVLNKPNPFYTRQELFEAGQQHQELTGEMWWVVARNPRASMPVELWPIRPDRMQPVTSVTDYIVGYIYTSPDGEKVPLGRDEVIFIRRPNPLDPFRGFGPVQSVLTYIDAERYSTLWNRNFYLNGAIPGGIIEVGKTLSDPEFDRMNMRWREQHQGIANAHRVAILEQAKWVDVKYTHDDMQFAELSSIPDEKIRRAFGFPKPMLGDTEDSNRAVAQAAEYVFARWLMVPRLERIKAALNVEFLPLFPGGEQYEFDYDSPVPEDEEAENAERDSKVKAVVELVHAGFDAPAVLEWLGLPELPYSKPEPPMPVSPPPDENGGSGLGQEEREAEAIVRLGRFIMDAPEGAERDRRIEALRALAAAADAHRDQALTW